MLRRTFAIASALSLANLAPLNSVVAQGRTSGIEYADQLDRYSDDQLDNLVGAIALYPDALLAQVLIAATFPDQVEEAARFVRANGTANIDDQQWDVSVKAVAHYPSALNTMADKGDWTVALGRAYAGQSSEVMSAVQRLRRMADGQGNLQSTPQQTVSREDNNYVIAPTQTRVIYVPVYDPYVIYTRPVFRSGFYSPYWSFGLGFPIGGWLSYDCNWRSRSVYYNGWDTRYYGYASGWRARSRPFISITNIYVNSRYRNVYINRDVIRRRVEYRNIDRYPGVHRDTRFGTRDVDYRDGRDRVRDNRDDRYVPERGRGSNYYDGRRDDGRRDDSRRDDSRRDDGRRDDSRFGGNRDNGNRDNSNRDYGNRDNGNRDNGNRDNGNRDNSNRDNGNRDNGNRDNGNRGGNRDAGRSPREQSAPERYDGPMVNPRRAEPAPAAPNGGQPGQQGGQRGTGRGPEREARERPKV